jgi:hypothetical protein
MRDPPIRRSSLGPVFETKPTLFTLDFIACANLAARFSQLLKSCSDLAQITI